MKSDIVRFLKEMHRKYGLNALYIPSDDVYCVHRKGRAVQNFTSAQFYDFPKGYREQMYRPLVKVGLARNLNESYKNQFVINTKQGIKIC
jgi:hypothetical protein